MDLSDGEIYRKHADELTRFATGLVGPNHACDVVAEAVLRCMSSSHWAGVDEKRAYLFRSVYNEAARIRRVAIGRNSREERAARREALEEIELRPEILSAVSQLSIRQRAVIVLTYWSDLTPSSIAQLLDISEGSVRRHLARARSKLKEVLNVDD